MNNDGNVMMVFLKIKKDYPKINVDSMECIDDRSNSVFSVKHQDFGKCVFKFLSTDRNIQRYLEKVYPAITELYKRSPHHHHIATIEKPEEYAHKKYFVIIREYGESFKKYLEQRKTPFTETQLLEFAYEIAHGLG